MSWMRRRDDPRALGDHLCEKLSVLQKAIHGERTFDGDLNVCESTREVPEGRVSSEDLKTVLCISTRFTGRKPMAEGFG